MAQQQEENAEMEEVRAPLQLPLAQHLARPGAPGIGLAVKADQRPHKEGREAEIGYQTKRMWKIWSRMACSSGFRCGARKGMR